MLRILLWSIDLNCAISIVTATRKKLNVQCFLWRWGMFWVICRSCFDGMSELYHIPLPPGGAHGAGAPAPGVGSANLFLFFENGKLILWRLSRKNFKVDNNKICNYGCVRCCHVIWKCVWWKGRGEPGTSWRKLSAYSFWGMLDGIARTVTAWLASHTDRSGCGWVL